MDQSNRYADLSLKEEDLIAGGKHILVAYKMKPKPGYAATCRCRGPLRRRVIHRHQCRGVTTDDFTRGLDALVYYIDEATEDMRIAYPMDLFDRNMTDGRMMMVSIPDAGDRQQPGHGRHRARQDSRLLLARARHPVV